MTAHEAARPAAPPGYLRVVVICSQGHEHERSVPWWGFLPPQLRSANPDNWFNPNDAAQCLVPDDLPELADLELRLNRSECERRGHVRVP